MFAAAGAALAIALVLLLVFGNYSRRVTVAGQLLPEQGVVRLHAPSAGIITSVLVAEGEPVRAGAVLFQLTNPRYASDGRDTKVAIMRTVEMRHGALQKELQLAEALVAHEQDKLRQRLANLERQKVNLARQRDIASERQEIAQAALEKFSKLAATGFISAEQLQQKQAAMLEQAQAVAMLDQQVQELDEQLASTRKDLAATPLQLANTRSGLTRNYQQVEEEMLAYTADQGGAVIAPVAGKVTAMLAKPGSMVGAGQLLGTLVPAGAKLQANLYVPSKGVGFIRPGAQVHLRYRAYPYQKYGQAQGTVLDVSATSMRPDELDNQARAMELAGTALGEPVYRVRVELSSQEVEAQGRRIPLLAGALLDADIVLERKPLYQWMLDPISKFTTELN
ncbi:MAG TPA: HlyD family efflux transporter periplasmic adaptor subunit [Noviherbaspirillum sp.]|nr:HlyD family efflux transporter periplasmic adaptor subunit [Noviherbaspirillum sp.]